MNDSRPTAELFLSSLLKTPCHNSHISRHFLHQSDQRSTFLSHLINQHCIRDSVTAKTVPERGLKPGQNRIERASGYVLCHAMPQCVRVHSMIFYCSTTFSSRVREGRIVEFFSAADGRDVMKFMESAGRKWGRRRCLMCLVFSIETRGQAFGVWMPGTVDACFLVRSR